MSNKEPMTAEDAIRTLKEHQRWRLGKTDTFPCTPKMLTASIDTLLEEIERLKEEVARNNSFENWTEVKERGEYLEQQALFLQALYSFHDYQLQIANDKIASLTKELEEVKGKTYTNCNHYFIAKDENWKACNYCGQIAPIAY
jgi:hypothetical protein